MNQQMQLSVQERFLATVITPGHMGTLVLTTPNGRSARNDESGAPEEFSRPLKQAMGNGCTVSVLLDWLRKNRKKYRKEYECMKEVIHEITVLFGDLEFPHLTARDREKFGKYKKRVFRKHSAEKDVDQDVLFIGYISDTVTRLK